MKKPSKPILHKWSEHFKHNGTWWQQCRHCGVYRIHLMSKPYYSPTGTIEDCYKTRPECKRPEKA